MKSWWFALTPLWALAACQVDRTIAEGPLSLSTSISTATSASMGFNGSIASANSSSSSSGTSSTTSSAGGTIGTVGTVGSTSSTSTGSTTNSTGGAVTVSHLAGDGYPGFVDGPAGQYIANQFNQPWGVATDALGNLFVADMSNNRIAKIDPNGNVTNVAGDGTAGFLDGDAATARFWGPQSVAVDGQGNIVVADTTNLRIRRIDTQGHVTTLAGNGTLGFVDGSGATAQFRQPIGVAFDLAGNVLVADETNNRIRKIDANGNVSTFAGNGTGSFADGPAENAEFYLPSGVVVDGQGNVFVADQGNSRVRKIDAQGNVTTVAGNGHVGHMDGTGGPNGTAEFDTPLGVTLDNQGNIFVADKLDESVRKIDPNGNVTSWAGWGSPSATGAAIFLYPTSVVFSALTNEVFVADSGHNCIRRVEANLNVSIVSGGAAEFELPWGVAIDSQGSLFVADTNNNRIRKIDTNGNVSTFAGNGNAGFMDGTGGPNGAAEFNHPAGIVLDSQGNFIVADQLNHRIRKVAPNGMVSTIAGNGTASFADGSGGAQGTAEFNGPYGLALDAQGNIIVADSGNNRIRKVDTSGNVTTVAGNGTENLLDGTGGADGTAEFGAPHGVAVGHQGDIFVADYFNSVVRKIDSSGNVTTIAGSSYGNLDGPALQAEFMNPESVAADADGNLIISDSDGNYIRKLDTQGNVTTLAGNGRYESYADGPASSASFSKPAGLAFDAEGNIIVVDSANNCLRKITQ